MVASPGDLHTGDMQNRSGFTPEQDDATQSESMRVVVLYDGPVILERARQLMQDMHGTMQSAAPLDLANWQIEALDAEFLAPYLHRSLTSVQMIVVAVNALRPLPEQVLRHLAVFLAPLSGEKRAMMAFLEGRSPSARSDGKPFAQLGQLASRYGVDFFAHVADPAPRPAWTSLDLLPPSALQPAVV